MHLKLFNPPHYEKEDRVDDDAKHHDRLESGSDFLKISPTFEHLADVRKLQVTISKAR